MGHGLARDQLMQKTSLEYGNKFWMIKMVSQLIRGEEATSIQGLGILFPSYRSRIRFKRPFKS